MQPKNIMIIDGTPVQIEGERNLLEVIRKAGIEMPVPSATTPTCPFTAPAVCAWWRTRGAA